MLALLSFALKNWTWLVPLAVAAGIAVDDGLLRIDYAEQKTTIADMKTAHEKELRDAAEAAERFAAADEVRTNAVLEGLNKDKASLQERLDAANRSLADVPPPVSTPAGCPDPMADPGVSALLRSLPRDTDP